LGPCLASAGFFVPVCVRGLQQSRSGFRRRDRGSADNRARRNRHIASLRAVSNANWDRWTTVSYRPGCMTSGRCPRRGDGLATAHQGTHRDNGSRTRHDLLRRRVVRSTEGFRSRRRVPRSRYSQDAVNGLLSAAREYRPRVDPPPSGCPIACRCRIRPSFSPSQVFPKSIGNYPAELILWFDVPARKRNAIQGRVALPASGHSRAGQHTYSMRRRTPATARLKKIASVRGRLWATIAAARVWRWAP